MAKKTPRLRVGATKTAKPGEARARAGAGAPTATAERGAVSAGLGRPIAEAESDQAKLRAVSGTVSSQQTTDTTRRQGLASPNPRLRPGATSDVGTPGAAGTRAPQPALRPGATAARPAGGPLLNPTPRAAVTSRAGGPTKDPAEAREQALRDKIAAAKGAAPIKVMATQMGYYDHVRRRPGDVFTISGQIDEAEVRADGTPNPRVGEPIEFSDRWMEKVPEDTPEKVTLGNEAIRAEHDTILALRAQQGVQVGRDDVPETIATGEHNPIGDRAVSQAVRRDREREARERESGR